MAIAFARVHYITRAKGHSAVAAIAYRSGNVLHDNRTGKTENYVNRSEHVAYSEIYLPDGADEKFRDRELLWNAVEAAEDRYNTRRKQAQVARDCILALPRDESMTKADHIELARRFAYEHFVKHGLVVDINIHYDDVEEDDDDGEGGKGKVGASLQALGRNPHAHLLVTTRRLNGSEFDRYKARDLDPKINYGKIKPENLDFFWGDEWRKMQNQFFKEKGLELLVDPNGLVSQVHLGKETTHHGFREKTNHWKENEARKQEAIEITLTDPEAVLNQVTLHQSIFTEKDLVKSLHRLFVKQGLDDDPTVFQSVLARIKSSDSFIALGTHVDGKEYFTTRLMFETENDIQDFADFLKQKTSQKISTRLVDSIIKKSELSQQESESLKSIMYSSRIMGVLAREGTDKYYLLKVANHLWVRSGHRVHGLTLSGSASERFTQQTNIAAKTTTAFLYALRAGRVQLNKKDIIILDDAARIDSPTYREILNAVTKSGAKFVYVGDPDASKPFGPGASMEALLERTSFVELSENRRQEVVWQQEATRLLAKKQVKEAVALYDDYQCLHFSKDQDQTIEDLIQLWLKTSEQHGVQACVIRTMAQEQADIINNKARTTLIANNVIHEGVVVDLGENSIHVSIGERLQFLLNDRQLGVKNGQLGTVTRLVRDRKGHVLGIELRLDHEPNQTVMVDLKQYQALDYGYASTIHKLHGQETDHGFTYISGYRWNRHYAYLAQSAHRKSSHIFVNQSSYTDLQALQKGLSKEALKDGIYHWPWMFRERRHMPSSQKPFLRFKSHLSNFLHQGLDQLRDRFEERYFPERYWNRKQRIAARNEKEGKQKENQQHATKVYEYTEAAKESGKLWHEMMAYKKQFEDRFSYDFDLIGHEAYQPAFTAMLKRNALASDIADHLERYDVSLSHYHIESERILKQARTHHALKTVTAYCEEQNKGRIIFRDRLAAKILEDASIHALGVSYHGLDWKEIRTHALAHQRRILVKSLDDEAKIHFKTVETYIDAYWNAAKLWREYFELKSKISQSSNKNHEYYADDENDEAEQSLSTLAEQAQHVSDSRNELAAVIYRNPELYRKGLDFHQIHEDSSVVNVYAPYRQKNQKKEKVSADTVFAKRWVKLKKYAHQAMAKERILAYCASQQLSEKEALAHEIHRYPRFHRKYLYQYAKETKTPYPELKIAIEDDARRYRKVTLLARLDDLGKKRLQEVEQLYRCNRKVRDAWRIVYNQKKSSANVQKANELSQQRDQLATAILEHLDDYREGLRFYEISEETLQKSLVAQACHDRVKQFQQTNISLREKMALAQFIVNERRAHNAAMSLEKLDWRLLYPYADAMNRQARFRSLVPEERKDYITVWRYVRLKQRLARIIVYKKKNHVTWSSDQQHRFNDLAAKRDRLAAQLLIHDELYYHYFDLFRLTHDKLQKHASRHIILTHQLRHYMNERSKLLKTFSDMVNQHGSVDVLAAKQDEQFLAWRQQWQQLSTHASTWLRQRHKIMVALNSVGLDIDHLEKDVNLIQNLDQLITLKLDKTIDYKQVNSEAITIPKPVVLEEGKRHWNLDYIKEQLNLRAEEVAMAAVSADETFNTKKSTPKELVWGAKGGSLHVAISGTSVGKWNDLSETGRGGKNLLSFIQAQQNLSFQDAVEWAIRFLGLSDNAFTDVISKRVLTVSEPQKISDQSFTEKQWKAIADSRMIWQKSRPIAGTLAERYLREHRAIKGPISEVYRFHPAVKNYQDYKTYPALVVGAVNDRGEVQATQAIFLDKKTGNKITSDRQKQNRGPIRGAAVWLAPYREAFPIILVEGPETAASIFEAKGDEWNVVCTLGSNNFKAVSIPKSAKHIIIAQDHDIRNDKTERSAITAANFYADHGKCTWLVKPKTPGDDFNDVHQKQGIEAVRQLLDNPTLYRYALNPDVELTKIQKAMKSDQPILSKDTWQREARQLSLIGQDAMAFDLLEKQGCFYANSNQAQAITHLLDSWFQSSPDINHSSLMVSGDPDISTLLNEGARFLLKKTGRIQKPILLNVTNGYQEFGVGDLIRFDQGWLKKNISENELGRIQGMDRGKLEVKLSDGRIVQFRIGDYPHISYGYVLSLKQLENKNLNKAHVFLDKSFNLKDLKLSLNHSKEVNYYYDQEVFQNDQDLRNAMLPQPKVTKEISDKKDHKKRKKIRKRLDYDQDYQDVLE